MPVLDKKCETIVLNHEIFEGTFPNLIPVCDPSFSYLQVLPSFTTGIV